MLMNDVLHTETIGRFTIKVYADYDYDRFDNPNEWGYMEAKLYSDNSNFYVMPDEYKNIWQVITNLPEGTHFYFVDWAQYSSSSNPELRGIESGGYTLPELAKEYWDTHNDVEKEEWTEDYGEDAIMEKYLTDAPDFLPSRVVIAVEPCIPEKDRDYSYHGFESFDKNAQNTLEDWRTYLEGATGFVIEDEEGDNVDSVWGFYGSDWEDSTLVEAKREAKHLEKEAKKADKKMEEEIQEATPTMETPLSKLLTSSNEKIKRLAKGIYKEISR